MKHTKFVTSALLLTSSALFVACGGGSTSNSNGMENNDMESGSYSNGMGNSNDMGNGSNIPYLRQNHANYTEHGSTQIPAPVKDANAKSISWTISASSEEGATKLAGHIGFMSAKLEANQNPRAFDKVFLMEAYMKFNKYYTTNVEQSATNVVVTKVANTACAYAVISAHSDVVQGDFFAQGILNIDHSATGEAILASSACDSVRAELSTYISQRQRTMGNMGMN